MFSLHDVFVCPLSLHVVLKNYECGDVLSKVTDCAMRSLVSLHEPLHELEW